MRHVLTAVLFLISITVFAQGGADRITFSSFDKPDDLALLDTVKKTLLLGSYGRFISQEKEVYNKNNKDNNFKAVHQLLNRLSKNGSDDISKCFHPRHSINFYKGEKIIKYVLICFECYGLRFSDERWVTKVKDEQRRIALMDELKSLFTKEGL